LPIDSLSTLTVFILATVAVVIVPGPSVTVIAANSLTAGTRAGLWSVLGTQLGVLLLIAVLALGFGTIMESIAPLFTVVRVVGAAYLVWLGVKLWRARGKTLQLRDEGTKLNAMGYVLQGFLVLCANPKALFFFGAFIPQFVNPSQPVMPQIFLLGGVFMLVAAILDSLYAIAAGRAGIWLTESRVVWVERLSGTFLFGGGVWLLAQGQR